MSDAILRTECLTKRFGGLTAVSEVSLQLHIGQVHAVIGPNGAGKSTLANLISGDLPPSGGAIHFRDETQVIRNLAGLKSDRIACLGIGRSYQKTNIFLPFSVFENCRLAAQAQLPRAWRIFGNADGYLDVNAVAERSLQAAGLEGRRGMPAEALSHGEQRQLEIAMCLATQPRVLLLDEPLAGMGAEESQRIIELIRQLTPAHAIMLIEHDMDAVFAVAQRLTVMVNGEVIETGSPEEIRASSKVQQAYLGDAPGGPHD